MIGIQVYIQSIEEKSQIIMGKVEIVLNSLPMSGGDGPNSYSKNSQLQVSLSVYLFIFYLSILFAIFYKTRNFKKMYYELVCYISFNKHLIWLVYCWIKQWAINKFPTNIKCLKTLIYRFFIFYVCNWTLIYRWCFILY